MYRLPLRRQFVLTFCTLAVGVIAGCAAFHRGTTLVKWDKGWTDTRMTVADATGEYGLYGSQDVKPKVVVSVNKGDPLGFERRDGKIIAIAGASRTDLPDGTYYWNRR